MQFFLLEHQLRRHRLRCLQMLPRQRQRQRLTQDHEESEQVLIIAQRPRSPAYRSIHGFRAKWKLGGLAGLICAF
jgi:hypothetical protein